MMKSVWRCARALAAAAMLVCSVSGVAVAQSSRATGSATEQEIGAVRAVYQEVMQAIAANRLARRESTVQCDEDGWAFDVTVWRDRDGRVRQLTWEGGSDDHAETRRFYYDSAGRLRFVFATRGAVNGTGEEERVWYAADRRILRRTKRLVQGPGYPVPDVPPIWNPAEWLRNPCSGDT